LTERQIFGKIWHIFNKFRIFSLFFDKYETFRAFLSITLFAGANEKLFKI